MAVASATKSTSPLRHLAPVALGVFILGVVVFALYQLFNYLSGVMADSPDPTHPTWDEVTWQDWCHANQDLAMFAWQDPSDPRYASYDLLTDSLGSSTAAYLIKTPCELASLHDDPTDPQRPLIGQWLALAPDGGTLDLQGHLWQPINLYGASWGSVFNDDALVHLDGRGTTIANLKVTGFTLARYYTREDNIHTCDTGDPNIEQSDEVCADFDPDYGWFDTVGAAGLFGETYKLWTANYNLQNPIVDITAPSGIMWNALEEQACDSLAQAQEVRCLEHGGCPRDPNQALAIVTDPSGLFAGLFDDCPGTNYRTCTYDQLDPQGNTNVAQVTYSFDTYLSHVELTLYYYPDGSHGNPQRVTIYCNSYRCYFEYDLDNDDNPDFNAYYDLNGYWDYFYNYNSDERNSCSGGAALREQCDQARQFQQQRCSEFGCYLNFLELIAKIKSINWVDSGGTIECTNEDCYYSFTDTAGNNNSATINLEEEEDFALLTGQANLNYYYYPGTADQVRVEISCDTEDCEYNYYYTDYNDGQYDITLKSDLGENFSHYSDQINNLDLGGCSGYNGLDTVGTLAGNTRFTRITNVRVLNPTLTTSNLTSGYSVGGLVGLASGWTYFMTTSVEDGQLTVAETKPNYPLAWVHSRAFGGLVGTNYKSVVINASTSGDLHYQAPEQAYQYLNTLCTFGDFCQDGETTGVSILIGGIAGIADVQDTQPLDNVSNVCIMNSYSAADIYLVGDYLPNYEMIDPLPSSLWGENYGQNTIPSQPKLFVGGVAGYIVDTMVNNYYHGQIFATPSSQGQQLQQKLSPGRDAVINAITGHSLDEWDIELIDNWNRMVKDWAMENDNPYPVHVPYEEPPIP